MAAPTPRAAVVVADDDDLPPGISRALADLTPACSGCSAAASGSGASRAVGRACLCCLRAPRCSCSSGGPGSSTRSPEASPFSFDTVKGVIVGIAAILTPLLAIWGVARSASRWLLTTSARGARVYVEHARDPMQTMKEHFAQLVEWLGFPLAIVIDDLDRCKPPFAVELLEGIQTLFRDVPCRVRRRRGSRVARSQLRRGIRLVRRCFRRARSAARLSVSREDLSDDAAGSGDERGHA